MTGHHHEPFDDADLSAEAPKGAKGDRSHLLLWSSVAATMVFIVGFWLVLLPSQFGKSGTFAREAERLQQIQASGYQETMRASLDAIRSKLDAAADELEARQAAANPEPSATGDTVYSEQVQHLQEQIEQGTASNPPTTAPQR
jgi:hypothetical protein